MRAVLTPANLFPQLKMGPLPRPVFNLCLGLFLIAFYNNSLWQALVAIVTPANSHNVLVLGAFAAIIVLLINLLLSLPLPNRQHKLLACSLIITAAGISYFMETYGIMIDRTMVQNLFETDVQEAGELLSIKLAHTLFFQGVLPSILIWKLDISEHPIRRQFLFSLYNVIGSLITVLLICALFYKDISLILRENRQLRYMVTPVNYIYYSLDYLSGGYNKVQQEFVEIATDAKLDTQPSGTTNAKPMLTLLVVGETARAANFSLNGYHRDTNPALAKQAIINFSNVTSCGTSTAVSVPCMFSDLPEHDFDVSKARYRENLMDVLARAGIATEWRENNSGCKGVCDRTTTFTANAFDSGAECTEGRCMDGIMLNDLTRNLSGTDNAVVVLHQLGSHGPAYHKRYPARFEQFTPVCTRADVNQCDQQSIVNGYDNSILYTDHILSQAIEQLKTLEDRYATSLIYLSDHGESLGENGLYLHGLPKFMAPREQTEIPMLAWFSDSFSQRIKLDTGCLRRQSSQPYSHDNLYHSVLGIMGVSTQSYQPALDMFRPCRDLAEQNI